MAETSTLKRHLTLRSAMALVVANIIGAGIFTSTGFQAADLGHPGYIFVLWIVGGVLAFCGALCYAELGAMFPEAGAEYAYLRNTYGRLFGFMSAFVSLTAGFSAPIAAAVKSFMAYAAHFIPVLDAERVLFTVPEVNYGIVPNDVAAAVLVWLLVAVHWRGMRGGISFNDIITLFKVCGIVAIILCAFAFGNGEAANFTRIAPAFETMESNALLSAFATSLIFVMFCYSGWNAAAYMGGEMRDPQRDLPRALLIGTAIVTVLYLGLNAVYFYGADVTELAGEVEVGLVAGAQLFGPLGVTLVTIVLCVSILASASAMVIAGPRVYYAFGRDFRALRFLSHTSEHTGTPTWALLLQGVVTTFIIFTGHIDAIQQYAGFTLSLFATLAVSCVFVLRWRAPNLPRPFKAWGYPVTPLLFIAVMVWTMWWAVTGARWLPNVIGLCTVAVAGLVFFAVSLLFPEGEEG